MSVSYSELSHAELDKNIVKKKKKNIFTKLSFEISKNYELYLLLLPAIIYKLIFDYVPMYGILIAFKDYVPKLGIWGSRWIGFRQFERFFNSYYFWELIRNTVSLNVFQLVIGFPAPIIFALLLNQVQARRFKKLVQTVTYAPHFISTVVLIGMLKIMISPRTGMINIIIKALGGEAIHFEAEAYWFRPLYILSGIWQNMGWSAIIYIAALTSIDPELTEAAIVDGASKLKRIWYIDIPGILPTIVILLILEMGSIMSVGLEKVYLMQTPINLVNSETISTFVYKVGLLDSQFSFSTAVNLFDTVINLLLLIIVNQIAKKVSEISLW